MSIGNAGSNTTTANNAEVSNLLVQGFKAAKEGRRDEAYDIFCDVVKRDPNNELGWLYRAATTQDLSEAYVCLQRVLNINPANEKAQRGVERIQNRLSAEPNNRAGAPAANGGSATPPTPAISEREVISGFNPGFSRGTSAAPDTSKAPPPAPNPNQAPRYPYQAAPSPFNQAQPAQVEGAAPPPYRPNFGQYETPGPVEKPPTASNRGPLPPVNYVPAGGSLAGNDNNEELVYEPVQSGPVGSQQDSPGSRRAGLVGGLAAARQRGRAAFGTDTPTDLDRNGQRRSRQILIPLVILGIVLVIAALLVLLLPSLTRNSNDTATATSQAVAPATTSAAAANTPAPTGTPGGKATTAAAAITVPVVGVTTEAATTAAATTAPATTVAPSPTAAPATTAPATTTAPTPTAPPPPTATQAPPPATTAPAAPALPRAAVYVIKGGDNLTRIASQYSTSIEAIQAANPGLQANTIFAGNRIIVPVSRPDFRGKGAIIGANETLQTIADRFKVSVDDLARFNGYASPADAKPGDALLIQ
jgi:LysM repeat protein